MTSQEDKNPQKADADEVENQAGEVTSGTEADSPRNDADGGTTELEQLQEELARFRDHALRAEAEMQNVRRRAERDVENAHKYGLERFIQNLLPIVDALEKAVESAEQADDAGSTANQAIVEGVGLCRKLLIDMLNKEGVAVVDPEGEPFDPNLHQAITMVESATMEPNSVVAVVQKGYSLNGRLVRPAMVMVAKSAASKDASSS